MAKTLTGNAGTTGSFTITDSDTLATATQSLAGSKTVVAAPAVIPTSPSDTGWNTNQFYSTSMHRSTYTGIDSSTGTTITFSTLADALCGTAALSKLHTLYVENLGAQELRLTWSVLVDGGTTPYLRIPAYSKIAFQVPMDGVSKGATTTIVLKSAASTTSAFVVLTYSS